MNISGTSAAALTSALHEVVQSAVIAALQEVAAASTGAPASVGPSALVIPPPSVVAAAAATPANTVPTATSFQTADTVTPPAKSAALPVRTHRGVTYHVPHPDASGPFYWVNRGRNIGVFATW